MKDRRKIYRKMNRQRSPALCESRACIVDANLRELYLYDDHRHVSYYMNIPMNGPILYQGLGDRRSVFSPMDRKEYDLTGKNFEFQQEILEIPLESWSKYQSTDPQWELEIYFDNNYYIHAKGKKEWPFQYDKLLSILGNKF